MTRQGASRADSSSRSTHDSQTRSIKRNRRSESPIYLSSIALVTPEEAKQARQRFFDALGSGDQYPGMPRTISSADQLTEVQLKRFFDILHACGGATDEQATLLTTRASIGGFLDAVFNDWASDCEAGLVKPELDFLIEAEVVVGAICTTPDHHGDLDACKASNTCNATVSAVVSYNCNPAMFKMEFTMVDPFTRQPESFCPLGRTDIRWTKSDWRDTLRQTLEGKLVSKVHRYNKHLAIWHARKLIQDWSKGSVSMGSDLDSLGFMNRSAAALVLVALGESSDMSVSQT